MQSVTKDPILGEAPSIYHLSIALYYGEWSAVSILLLTENFHFKLYKNQESICKIWIVSLCSGVE